MRLLLLPLILLWSVDCRFEGNEHLSGKIREITQWADGIIFPGNPYSIDPQVYGEAPQHPERIDPDPGNFQFAKSMIETAEQCGIPILGICTGAWYLNVVYGGTLRQEITPFPGMIHDADPRDGSVTHSITIVPNTLLFSALQSKTAMVNSWHDQSIGVLAPGFRIAAHAPDGVPEAIEKEVSNFCVGIQFHPEYLEPQSAEILKQQRIFTLMVSAAKENQKEQKLPFWNSSFEKTKKYAAAFHRANTARLINHEKSNGKLKIR